MGPAGQISYEDTVLSDAVNKIVSESSNIKHRFPLEHQGDYEGSISFYAFEEDYIELQDVKRTIFDLRKKEIESQTQTVAEAPGAGEMDLFGTEQLDIKPRKFKGDPKGAVSLYLPSSLQFADGIEYSNTPIGARGALAEQALANGGAAAAIAASLGDLPLVEIMKNGVTGPAGQLALQRVLAKTPLIGGETLSNVAALTSGLTLNPNSRSLLRGVNTRTFRFAFNLIPTSVDESRSIRNIIKFFRSAMYPEDIGGKQGATIGYKFPHKFVIKMRYKKKTVATGILPCFLENFETNYNPNTMGMMSDGSFPEINISMGFREERTLRKKDIEGGY